MSAWMESRLLSGRRPCPSSESPSFSLSFSTPGRHARAGRGYAGRPGPLAAGAPPLPAFLFRALPRLFSSNAAAPFFPTHLLPAPYQRWRLAYEAWAPKLSFAVALVRTHWDLLAVGLLGGILTAVMVRGGCFRASLLVL